MFGLRMLRISYFGRFVSASDRAARSLAIIGTRQIDLLLPDRHLPDEILRNHVDRARHPERLLQDDLVVVRNIRIQDRLRDGAGEPINGLVVVAGQDEVLRMLAPLPERDN